MFWIAGSEKRLFSRLCSTCTQKCWGSALPGQGQAGGQVGTGGDCRRGMPASERWEPGAGGIHWSLRCADREAVLPGPRSRSVHAGLALGGPERTATPQVSYPEPCLLGCPRVHAPPGGPHLSCAQERACCPSKMPGYLHRGPPRAGPGLVQLGGVLRRPGLAHIHVTAATI